MKLGATGRGKSQLSFAPLFMSIQAFSDQKTFRELSSNWGGGTWNLQGGAIYIRDGSLIIRDSSFVSNQATGIYAHVSVVSSCFEAFPHK